MNRFQSLFMKINLNFKNRWGLMQPLALLFMSFFISDTSFAKLKFSDIGKYITPNGSYDTVRDQFGNSYPIGTLFINDTLRKLSCGDTLKLVKSTIASGYFQLYLEPGCGMENYASDPIQYQRLQTVSQVFSDMANFISTPCTSTNQKVNILIRNSNSILYPYSSYLPVVGLSLFDFPLDNTKSGILDNLVWQTIQSGKDGFSNIYSPFAVPHSTSTNTTSFFHGILGFDFNSQYYTFNLGLSNPNFSSSNCLDLYTITLRELLHTLGITTLINSNGQSVFGASQSYFSRFDLNLIAPNGQHLITTGSNLSIMYNATFNANLSTSILQPNSNNCQTDYSDSINSIRYKGTLTNPQAVFTPNCWESGLSLNCMEDMYIQNVSQSNQNNAYFVTSNITLSNSLKRSPTPIEAQILADLGYNISQNFGVSANLNVTSYSNLVVTTLPIANNDGFNQYGQYSLVSNSTGLVNFQGGDLLSNDIIQSGGSFEGLEVMGGASIGSFNITSGNTGSSIIFTPSNSTDGVVVVRYVPVSSTGIRGNVGYGALLLGGPCNATSPCGFLQNGNFESSSTGCGDAVDNYNVTTACWAYLLGTPDLYNSNSTFSIPSINTGPANGSSTCLGYVVPTNLSIPNVGFDGQNPNSAFFGLFGQIAQYGVYPYPSWAMFYGPNCWTSEGLQIQLANPLVGGVQYSIDFYARNLVQYSTANTQWPIDNGNSYLQFGFDVASNTISNAQVMVAGVTTPPLSATAITPSSLEVTIPSCTIPYAPNTTDPNWVPCHATFTPPIGTTYTYFFVYNDINKGLNGIPRIDYTMIDDINIYPTPQNTYTFNLPATMSSCGTLTNMYQYLSSGTPQNGTFSGPNLSGPGGSTFTPSASSPSISNTNVPISYTYNTGLPCPATITISSIIFVQSGVTITDNLGCTTPPSQVCANATYTLSANCSSCSWNVTPASIASQMSCTNCTSPTSYQTPSQPIATYVVTDQNSGCVSAPYVVTVYNPVINIVNPIAHCLGDQINLNVTIPNCNSNNYSVSWYDGSNALLQTVTNSNLFSITPSVAGTYQYHCIVTTANCSASALPITVVINPLPVATIQNNGPGVLQSPNHIVFCQSATSGTSIQALPSNSFFSYAWYRNSATTSISSNQILTVNGPLGVTYYTVVVTDNNGCSGTSPAMEVEIIHTPTILTNPISTSVCQGTVANFSIVVQPPTTNMTYQWYCNFGSTPFLPLTNNATYSGVNSNSLTINNTQSSFSGFQYYCIVSTQGSSCSTMSLSATLNVLPTPTITASGQTNFCQGGSVVLTSSNSPTYQWLNTNNPIAGATNQTLTVSNTGIYSVTNSFGCVSLPVAVNVVPNPVVSLSANTPSPWANCDRKPYTFSVTPNNGYSYSWQILNGGSYINLSPNLNGINYFGLGTNTLTITPTPSVTTNTMLTLQVVVTNAIGCSTIVGPIYYSIVVAWGNCQPCNSLGNDFILLGTNNSISQNFTPSAITKFYLPNSANVYGNVIMNNAVVTVDNTNNVNTEVDIQPTASLILRHNHYYTCDNFMWSGFKINHDNSNNVGAINLSGNTLIEDATVGISMLTVPAAAHNLYATNFIDINDAIFNRCGTGLDLENYNASSSQMYPLSIVNTIFTSRDFSGYSNLFNYPLDWPKNYQSTAPLGLKETLVPTSFYLSPYKISDNTYPKIQTKVNVQSQYGIFLSNIGYSPNNSIVPNGIVIGSGGTSHTNYKNVFDNLNNGIYGLNSDVTIYNSTFLDALNDGAYFTSSTGNSAVAYPTVQLLPLSNNVTTYYNEFYNCVRAGVESVNIYNLIGQNSYMYGYGQSNCVSHFPSPPCPFTKYGYFVTNTVVNNTTNIRFNNIYNIATGVMITQNSNKLIPQIKIAVCQNHIIDDPGSDINFGPPTYCFVNNGIYISNLINNINVNNFGYVHTDSNIIKGQNGIYLNNFKNGQDITSADNVIQLRFVPNKQLPAPLSFQYGIYYSSNMTSYIERNTISSNTKILSDSMRAVHVTFGTTNQVLCNNEFDIGRGYEFWGNIAQHNTQWLGNSMQNNLKGFILNRTVLDNQPTLQTTNTGNNWNGTWPPPISVPPTPGHYGTFVYDDNISQWKCKNSSLEKYFSINGFTSSSNSVPPNNGAQNLGNQYGTLPLSIVGPQSPNYNCDSDAHHHFKPMVVSGERIALDSFGFVANSVPLAAWMTQFALYQIVLSDSNLVDSSLILLDFDSLASHTRYKYIISVENALAKGCFGQAQSLINNTAMQLATNTQIGTNGAVICDSSAADSIVYTHIWYYQLYKKYMQNSLSSNDSLSIIYIANLCPNIYGAGVFAARALYSLVYDDPIVWDDDNQCGYDKGDVNTDISGFKRSLANRNEVVYNTTELSTHEQSYLITPNPNHGSFSIIQSIHNTGPVKVEIMNTLGQIIFSKIVNFENRVFNFKTDNLPSGHYFVRISDEISERYNLRFVVE